MNPSKPPKIPIKPLERVTTRTLHSLEIVVDRILLNVSANVNVRVFDDQNELAEAHALKLEGEDYAKWTDEDQYIVEFVCSKLGFELSSPDADS